MSKREAYAELRKKIDAINEALKDARKFADDNDLVMTHKKNKRRPYPGEDEDDYYEPEYGGDLTPLLTVKTLKDKGIDWDDPTDVFDAEIDIDYAWLPSSIKC